MKKHVKNYLEAKGLADGDFVFCERCRKTACDIHHIVYRSHGGSDDYSNLAALCRNCHTWAHSNGQVARNELLEIVSKR